MSAARGRGGAAVIKARRYVSVRAGSYPDAVTPQSAAALDEIAETDEAGAAGLFDAAPPEAEPSAQGPSAEAMHMSHEDGDGAVLEMPAYEADVPEAPAESLEDAAAVEEPLEDVAPPPFEDEDDDALAAAAADGFDDEDAMAAAAPHEEGSAVEEPSTYVEEPELEVVDPLVPSFDEASTDLTDDGPAETDVPEAALDVPLDPAATVAVPRDVVAGVAVAPPEAALDEPSLYPAPEDAAAPRRAVGGFARALATLAGTLFGGLVGAIAGLTLLAVSRPGSLVEQLREPVQLWRSIDDPVLLVSAVLVASGFLLLGYALGRGAPPSA